MKETYTLYNGVHIPVIGFGTYKITDSNQGKTVLKKALAAGYRHIDTASYYNNEEMLGEAIATSGIKREELFITTKLWNADRNYESALLAFEVSLKKMNLDYIDLYLIHWPANEKQFANWKEINTSTWRALEVLYKQGKVKAIGVSNFKIHHLEALLENAEIRPMVNQIEYHPGFKQEDVVAFCQEQAIQIIAWSPLARGRVLEDNLLIDLAAKYEVSTAQLCLRWMMQKNIIPIPKSTIPKRINDNKNVFNFTINTKDIVSINNLPYIASSGLDSDDIDF